MSNNQNWEEEFDNVRPISYKKRIDKDKFCKKNKIGNKKYGPHVYGESEKRCDNCGHKRKEYKFNYEY